MTATMAFLKGFPACLRRAQLIVLSMAGNNQASAFYESLGGVQVYEGSSEIAGTRIADKGHLFNNLTELAAPA